MLHTVNKSPDASALRQCLHVIGADDVLVLIEDGVYCALTANAVDSWLETPLTVYAILADVEARGLLGSLCVAHPASKRWS
jgi:sulfur relay protein TusB/DsrH